MNSIDYKLFNNNELYENLFNSFKNNKLPNSIIISGNKGIGKKSFIYFLINKIFTNILINTNHLNLINSNSHPNFIIVDREINIKTKKLKNYITIDQIRKLDSFIYKSSLNELPKFILINNADKLNINSSNSLLKIIEEPKNNNYFFIISHQLSNIIPTIRSRCVKFLYKNPNFEDFTKILKHKEDKIKDSDIEFLFDISNGSPGIALEFFSLNIYNLLENLSLIFKEKKPFSSSIIEISNNFANENNDNYESFLSVIKFILLNVIKIKSGVNISNLFISDIKNLFYEISEYINIDKCFNLLDYININEKDLLIYNLDKKIFTLNLFSEISE